MKCARGGNLAIRWLLTGFVIVNTAACGAGERTASLSDQEDPPGVGTGDDAVMIPDAVDDALQAQPPATPPANPLVPNPENVQLSEFEAKTIELTNAERQSRGLGLLSVSPRLQTNCRSWAATMARQRSMYHSNMNFSGENVAAGYQTPSAVVRGWMNSPGHRANILTGGFKTIGLGVVSAYWCQQFGR